MRTAFVNTMKELMKMHDDIIVVTADMGFAVFEELRDAFPDRFINSGVAEQASASVAAGLALSGYTVYFYAQASFATMRCFEQIRLDAAYNKANVKVVGTAAGFSLNQLGVSHFAIEDIGLMRMLPGMTVFTPGDAVESAWATKKAYEISGSAYIRIAKTGGPVIHKEKQIFAIGKGVVLSKGNDLSLFVCGNMLSIAKKVAENLERNDIHTTLISFPTVKPLDKTLIRKEAKKTGRIFTIEDHSIIGGLGSAVAEVIAEEQLDCLFHRIGVNDTFASITGSHNFLLDYHGLSEEKIVNTIKNKAKLKMQKSKD